jgi:hypothetical protein
VSQVLTVTVLTSVGLLIAYIAVPEPPSYHRTTYFEFALPDGWGCNRDGSETVCFPPGPGPYDATIIFAAKYRNDMDRLDAYRDHVSRPRQHTDANGSIHTSEVISYGDRAIGEYRWIDALHLGSELRDYYTRYLATTTSHIGVLITFSAHKKNANRRLAELETCVESLRIYQSPSRYN